MVNEGYSRVLEMFSLPPHGEPSVGVAVAACTQTRPTDLRPLAIRTKANASARERPRTSAVVPILVTNPTSASERQ